MPTLKLKIINPNNFDVNVKTGNGPTTSPGSSTRLGKGKTQFLGITKGKWMFADRTGKNKMPICLGQVEYNQQVFVIPQIPN